MKTFKELKKNFRKMNLESEVMAKVADKALQDPSLEQKIVNEKTENERVLVKDSKVASLLSKM